MITLNISYFMLTNVVPTFEMRSRAELPVRRAIVDASNWIQNGRNVLGIIKRCRSSG